MKPEKVISEVLGEEAVITPSDLYNTEFKSAIMGGYDKQEVDEFLEKTADAFEALITQVRQLKEQLEADRQELRDLREADRSLRETLAALQSSNADILDAARRQADALVEEGRLAKERLEREAAELPAALREEITALRAERNRLRMDLRAVLAAHSALLHEIPSAEELRRTQKDGAAEPETAE